MPGGQKTTMEPERQSAPPSKNLMRLLLAGFVFSSFLAMASLAYLALSHGRIVSLKKDLLSRADLQQAVIAQSDHGAAFPLYPHMNQKIGYALNPYLQEATLWGPPDQSAYPVNPLGLRGKPIRPPEDPVTRVLLLGDSGFFGWKLPEKEKLERHLEEKLRDLYPDLRFEVVTAALPGWNTINQKAFLEDHFHVLAPDIIVWSMFSNDVEDGNCAVPPGMLSSMFCPYDNAPAMHLDAWGHVPMPLARQRWEERVLAPIRSAQEKYQVPVLVCMIEEIYAPFWQTLLCQEPVAFPYFCLPSSIVGNRRWSVTEGDHHPGPWGNRQLTDAIAVMLSESGMAPSREYSNQEAQLLEQLRDVAVYAYSKKDVQAYYDRILGEWKEGIFEKTPMGEVSFGHIGFIPAEKQGEQSRMMQNRGALYLHVGKVDALRAHLIFELAESRTFAKRSVHLSVLNHLGEKQEATFVLQDGENDLVFPVPSIPEAFPVLEIRWQFDFNHSTGPLHWYSATFVDCFAESRSKPEI